MQENVKTNQSIRILRLSDMIFAAKGTLWRRFLHIVFSIAMRLFFRRIETVNAENVPQDGAIIFVINHPNGLIDPALVFCALPRRVSFLAKSTLFKIPFVSFLIRKMEALPVYRKIDAGDEMRKNFETFRASHELLANGRCIAIFPEGVSHDETELKPMKTGAARIALGALGYNGEGNALVRKGLKIMAVGMFYTSKTAFRSEALIRFGEIFDVQPVRLDERGEPPREAVRNLTDKIETALRDVTLNTENPQELEALTKAEALFSSVYETLIFRETLAESFLRLRDFAEKFDFLKRENPEKVSVLREKVARYENDLKKSGLTLEGLSVLQHPVWYVVRRLILRSLILIMLAPFAVLGAIIHSPAFVFANLIGLMFKTHGDDTAGPTAKILVSILLVPLTWIIIAVTLFIFFDWRFALASIPFSSLIGYIALRTSEELVDLSIWLKSAWLLFRERGLFLRLLLRRKKIQEEIQRMIDNPSQ